MHPRAQRLGHALPAGKLHPRIRQRRLGRRRRAVPSAVEQALLADAALVRASALFDAGWYIASHPALAESGGDPVLHYVAKGAAAGADPGPYFESAACRAAHPGCKPRVS
jgi:hypothetical protein